jgi:tRNA threonylcarbamoyladenosine biosynthesis protein TsaE
VLLTVPSIAGLPSVSANIVNYAGNDKIFLFYGDMGAGKTTLIKSLCEYLGTTEPVTSPNETEALDMGYEEYFYSDALCFVEWPDKIPGLLPENYISVKITVAGQNSRQIIVEKI